MELYLLKKISKWVSHTNDVGRDHRRHVRLSCIIHYRQVKLNLHLLRAVSDFWDHVCHVFHFNRCKLYPMMEEFGAIMRISNFDQILLPPKHADPILLLDEVLSIPYRFGSLWSMNDGFDSHTLVDHFSKAVDEECYPEALAIAVLDGFFLTGDFFKTNVVVLDAIGQMDRENLVPMILGETLHGLDELKGGHVSLLQGGPPYSLRYNFFLFFTYLLSLFVF